MNFKVQTFIESVNEDGSGYSAYEQYVKKNLGFVML